MEPFAHLSGIVFVMAHPRITLFLVMLLLMGTVPVQAASVLVCRLTGQPMAPIEAAPEALPAELACCAVKRSRGPDGRARLELAAPGCCDLSVTPGRPEQPTASVPVVAPFALALAPAPELVLAPPIAEVVAPAPVVSDASPRGPPGRPTSLRAPPFFS